MCVSACTCVSVCHCLPVRVWLSFISVLWSERALLLRLVSDQLTLRVKPWKFAKCFLKRGIQRRLAKLRHERVAVKRGWLECKTQVMVITLSPCRFRLWGPNICACVCVCMCATVLVHSQRSHRHCFQPQLFCREKAPKEDFTLNGLGLDNRQTKLAMC